MLLAQVADWSIALAPVLLMAVLFAWLDVFKLMSVLEMTSLLLLGAIAALLAWPLSGEVLDNLPMGYSFYSRMVAPWIEEALKGLALTLLIGTNRIGFKLDAIISGFAIGAGFSVVENMLFLLRFPDLPVAVWMVRGLGTAVMHGATTAVLAAVAHQLFERSLRREGNERRFNPLWLLPGYVLASLLHLAFNQFPDRPLIVMIVTLIAAPLLLIALLRLGESQTQAWLVQDSEGHRAWLAEWRAGGFPADASGQRIAALAARATPAEAELIRAFCILKTELVLTAEEELIDRDRRLEEGEADQVRAGFAKLAQLRKALGRTSYAALSRQLPFSANDEWELGELRELLGTGNIDPRN